MEDNLSHPDLEPTPAEPETSATEQPNAQGEPQGTEEPEPQLLAGKYESVEELERAKLETDREYSHLQQQLREAKERERLLIDNGVGQSATTPEPTEDREAVLREKLENELNLSETAINALVELAGLKGEAAGSATTQQLLTPLLNNAAARGSLAAEEQALVTKVFADDPAFEQTYNRAAAMDQAIAAQLLQDRVKLVAGTQATDEARAANAEVQAERTTSRRDAAIPARRTSKALAPQTSDDSQRAREKKIAELAASTRASGSPRDFATEVLKGLTIIDENGRRELT